MARENQRQYCSRHGYKFIDAPAVVSERPAAWAKLPAIVEALQHHQWVLWVDSDALVFDPTRGIEEYCDPRFDMVFQSLDIYFDYLGVDRAEGLERMPLNSGVFLVRASDWSKEFLMAAYQQEQFVSRDDIWNGIADQEAMIAVVNKHPQDKRRFRYVDRLQSHPKFLQQGVIFAHLYGNYARHRIPLDVCEEVIGRWERAISAGEPLPGDVARFHWCCIQNKARDAPVDRGNPHRFLYTAAEVLGDR